jgi:hypothetical protein
MTAAISSVAPACARGARGTEGPAPARLPPSLAPPGDLVSMLAAAQLGMRDARANQEKSCAESAATRRDGALEKAREAEKAAAAAQHAAEEAAHKSSLFKKIGIGAGIVAGAAAVVASGGTSAPAIIALAGVLLSASSGEIGEHCGKQWGGIAEKVGVGCSVLGGVGSLAELATSGATMAASRGALFTGAKLAEAGADAGAGIERGRAERFQGDAVDAHADALAGRASAKAAQREQEQVIELLRVAEKAARKGMQAVMAMANEIDATHRLEASSTGKAVRA